MMKKHLVLVAEAGVEQNGLTALQCNDLRHSADSGLAPSLAYSANPVPIDPDLAVLIAAWPSLTDADKSAILAIATAGRQ